MSDARPFSKSAQLERGPKRPSRIKATMKQWAGINAEKRGYCRSFGLRCHGVIQLHHVVPRSWGGDDVADNMVSLCRHHHQQVTARSEPETLRLLAQSLTDAEYAYCIGKLGEGAMERLFGIEYRQ